MSNLRRIYYYAVTSIAFIYLITALQYFIHQFLTNTLGLTDSISLAAILDLSATLPIFGDWRVAVAVLVIGAIHWFLLARDRSSGDEESGGFVRAFFLIGLMSAIGLKVVFALIVLLRNVGTPDVPISAAPLAGVIAGLIAVGLLEAERRAGPLFNERGTVVAKLIVLLGKWALVVGALWAIGQAIQASLQQWLQALSSCSTDLNIPSSLVTFMSQPGATCTTTPPVVGGWLVAVVAGAGLWIYVWWAERFDKFYDAPVLANIDAMVTMLLIGSLIVANIALCARLFIDRVTLQENTALPQSLLTTPGSETQPIVSYPFIGSLLAGIALLALIVWRLVVRTAETRKKDSLAFGIVAISYPVAFALFWGAGLLLGHLLSTIGYDFHIVTTAVPSIDWNVGAMLLIAGVIGMLAPGFIPKLTLLRELRGYGLGNTRSISPYGRIYVFSYLIILIVAAIISGSMFVVIVVMKLLARSPIDSTNYFVVHVLGFFIVFALGAWYHRNIIREGDMLRGKQ
jgi:hypothetical protein